MSERDHYRRRDTRLSYYDLDERRDPESIVKTYPSISYATESHLPIVAFEKLDGSNGATIELEGGACKAKFAFTPKPGEQVFIPKVVCS